MKRMLLLLLALSLLLAACAGGAGSSPAPAASQPDGVPLAEFCGGELEALLSDFDAQLPAAVEYSFYGEGDGCVSPLYGEEHVRALQEALLQVQVDKESGLSVTDSYGGYCFVLPDGSRVGISLNANNLDFDGSTYTLSGTKALFALRFPCFGNELSILAASPDAGIRAFYAASEENPPVLATLQTEGEAEKSVDGDAVRAVLGALYGVELYACEETPAAGADGDGLTPARSLSLTMADGTEYRFDFTGRSYVYEFPAPIGTRYYWTDDTADALWELF